MLIIIIKMILETVVNGVIFVIHCEFCTNLIISIFIFKLENLCIVILRYIYNLRFKSLVCHIDSVGHYLGCNYQCFVAVLVVVLFSF